MSAVRSWSSYNTLFHSERLGHFVYSALANALLQVDRHHFAQLQRLQDHTASCDQLDSDFLAFLQEHKVVLVEGEERRLLLRLQYDRNAQCFATSRLGLTICPTLQCNFRCGYCFETTQRNSSPMSHETVQRLLAFIGTYKAIRHLGLAWYGGEPLLAFDVIREITAGVRSLNVDFEGAALITNGYLLDRNKCELFNELDIRFVQVTLDGPQRSHDMRRVLAGGGPTFDRILSNVETLMGSTYRGTCHIRVNIDKHNADSFPELQALLIERFKGKDLSVYAAPIRGCNGCSLHAACSLNLREWSTMTFDAYERTGIMPMGDFYPSRDNDTVCVAIAHNRFVVGPAGELYKCWEDVGKPEMVVGNIHAPDPMTNPGLRAQYMVGTDAFSDPECLACSVLPICGGGCANKRLRAKQFAESGLEFCSPYKANLVGYLEKYVDRFLTREICQALMSPTSRVTHESGYRDISPPRPN